MNNHIPNSSSYSTPTNGYTKNTETILINNQNHIPNSSSHSAPTNGRQNNNIELTDEFIRALELIERQNRSVFLTGKAGTGKTTLLRYFRKNTRKNIVVLAPTGISAININGQTVHSFFKFPPKLIDVKNIKAGVKASVIRNADAVIIDEVSMLRADLMDGIDHVLRAKRKKNSPFGGLQMIFIGDLFQLPPVVREKELKDYFSTVYKSPYFFSSNVFGQTEFEHVELTKNYRQTDEQFIGILECIRNNQVNPPLLEFLNSRVVFTGDEDMVSETHITLTATNNAALEINEEFLERLPDQEYCYYATVKGNFLPSDFPTEPELRLRNGAKVMMLKNDPDKRWVNGTIGKISHLADDRVLVEINGKSYEVFADKWEKIEYKFENKKIEQKVIGTFEQLPLRLAWAITIHKSQGQTFDRVLIDLGDGAFAHGQTYVALSRCTTLEGIRLRRPVYMRDVIFDSRIYDFIRQ